MDSTWVRPVTLDGRFIRLEPLTVDHAADLASIVDPAMFRYFAGPRVTSNRVNEMTAYIRDRVADAAWVPLVMVLRDRGTAVGTTTFMDIRPQSRGLEIGSTWIGPAYQGTAINPEAKYLMLRHAFEDLGALRVQLKTDARNEQSRRAIEKLGATYEGILRKHLVLDDGFVRDTVMYSITDDDWPSVKWRLEARLTDAHLG